MEYCLSYCFRYSWLSGEWILVAQLMPISIPMIMLFSDYKSYWYYFTTGLVSSTSLLLSYIFKVQRSNPECINFFYAHYAFPSTEQVFLTSVLTMEILLVYRWNIRKILIRVFAILLIPWIYYASMISSLHIGYLSVLFSMILTYIILLIYSKIRTYLKQKQIEKNHVNDKNINSGRRSRKKIIKRGICGMTMRSTGVQSGSDDSDSDEHNSYEIIDQTAITHRHQMKTAMTQKNNEEIITINTTTSSPTSSMMHQKNFGEFDYLDNHSGTNSNKYTDQAINPLSSFNNSITPLYGSSQNDKPHSYNAKNAFRFNSFYAIDYDTINDDINPIENNTNGLNVPFDQ